MLFSKTYVFLHLLPNIPICWGNTDLATQHAPATQTTFTCTLYTTESVSSCRDWDKGREASGSTDQFLPCHISSHRHQQSCRGQTGERNQTIFPWGIYSWVEQPHVQLDNISVFARVAAYDHLAISFGCGRWGVERRKLHPAPGQPIIVGYALMDKSFPLSSDNVCPRSVIPRASTPPSTEKKKKKK